MLDYSGWAAGVKGLGPGRRVVLWVRGCTIGCPGCMSTELWAKGTPRPMEPLVDELLTALDGHDGLTLSGGEPFEQPEPLAELIRRLRQKRDVEVVSYSGFRKEKLEKTSPNLLRLLDILIDGPYRQHEKNDLQWRGSDNQRVLLLSDRAKRLYEADLPAVEPREIGLQSLEDGRFRLIGIPRAGEFEQIKMSLTAQGLTVGDSV